MGMKLPQNETYVYDRCGKMPKGVCVRKRHVPGPSPAFPELRRRLRSSCASMPTLSAVPPARTAPTRFPASASRAPRIAASVQDVAFEDGRGTDSATSGETGTVAVAGAWRGRFGASSVRRRAKGDHRGDHGEEDGGAPEIGPGPTPPRKSCPPRGGDERARSTPTAVDHAPRVGRPISRTRPLQARRRDVAGAREATSDAEQAQAEPRGGGEGRARAGDCG